MDDFNAWCLRVAGEFEPEVKAAAVDVMIAASAVVMASKADRQVCQSLLLEALARAEKRGNELGIEIGGRLAALVLKTVMEVL